MSSGLANSATKSPSEAAPETVVAPNRGLSPLLVYFLLLVVIVFFALVRYRLRDIPLERDEGEFAYGGQLILEGTPLYNSLYTLKLPGTYAAYAVLFRVFGQTPAGIHVALIFVNAVTTLLVFLLVARLFGRLAALIAAASYAALSTSPSVVGFAGHATHFVVLFAIGGALLLLIALERNRAWIFFSSGILFGLAFLMKQPGAFFLVWAVLYLLWRKRRRPVAWTELERQLAALVLGFVVPFAATCLMTWRSGSFAEFWFWTFSYANRYGTNAGLKYGLEQLRTNGADVLGPVVGIWLLAAVGVIAFLWNARARSHLFFSISFLVCSFLAVSPGLYFRNHYFIQMLPAVALLAGVAVGASVDSLGRRSLALSALPVLLFLVAFSTAIYRQRDFLFRLDPLQASKQVYGQNPFPEALEIARYIAANTRPDATVAVLGCEPEIFFYSHRHSPTGHTCAYPILEPTYGVTLQKQMESEIQRGHPDVIVLINDPTSWIAFPKTASPSEIMGWTNEYMKGSFELDGVVEMDKYGANYYWGERARKHPISMPNNILILKRKSSS